MFDKLVESAKQKQGKRARRLFLATGVIYTVALTVLGVMTIVSFSPALAEEYDVIICTVPPPPPPGAQQPPPIQSNLKPAPKLSFVTPKPMVDILLPDQLKSFNLEPRVLVSGAPSWTVAGREGGVPGVPDTKEPPPPPPTPTPVVKPAATPAPDQVVRLTSMLTQGRALRKAQPPYPAIAKHARVQGSVLIQIGISETGEVTETTLLSGHPLLREAALQAAKHWLFKPTELNGRPVRAIGVITFNFTLN